MDDRSALMGAIIANPDEDTPRLALADWLQEHGDTHDRARAEFIRLQIQAERLPEGNEKRKKLEASATELATAHKTAWFAPLTAFEGKVFGVSAAQITLTRGLLKYLMIRTGEFLQKGYQKTLPDALAAVGVESAHFYSATARSAALAASPAIRWFAHVSYPGLDDVALAAFGASPEWAHLSGLVFSEVKATDEGLKAFAASAGQSRLRLFGVTTGGAIDMKPKGKYTAAGVLAVLNSDRFPLLDALDLERDQPAKFAYETLLADPGLKRIRNLRIGSGAPMSAVALCPNLTGVRELRINSARITDSDAEALLANPAFAKLIKLQMYGMNWGHPRLSKPVEKRLRERFGPQLLNYSPEER